MGKFKFYIISALIITLSFLLISPTLEQFIPLSLRGYTSKIGEALLIGTVVSFTVDRFLKAELLAEIARDVLRFTVGYDLPEQVKQEVGHILRLPFVRRNFEMKLTITPHPTDPDYVKIKMLTCFEVENLSKRKQTYNFTSSISVSTYPELGQSAITQFEMTGRKAFSLSQEEIEKQAIDDMHFRKVTKQISLSPEGNEKTVFTTERVIYFSADDTYVLDILEPTLGVVIDIFAPDGFDWSVYFPVRGDVETFPEKKPSKFRTSGVFLPGQFVSIKWTKQ